MTVRFRIAVYIIIEMFSQCYSHGGLVQNKYNSVFNIATSLVNAAN
jgi:hypothetical protein